VRVLVMTPPRRYWAVGAVVVSVVIE